MHVIENVEPTEEHKEDKHAYHLGMDTINSEGPKAPSDHSRPTDEVLESSGKFLVPELSLTTAGFITINTQPQANTLQGESISAPLPLTCFRLHEY